SLGGDLSVKLSRNLHRDLVWQARTEGVELGQLLAEMLAAGLEARRQRGPRRQPNAASPNERGQEQPVSDQQPRGDRGPGRGGYGRDNRGQGGRYHAIMEDRATFLEYVRNLDQPGGGRGGPYSGGGGGGGGRGGGPRRDRGPGGGRGRPGGSPNGP